MAFKALLVCAFAFMVQSIAGKSCYRPLPQPNCGISSGSVTIDVIETKPVVSRSSYRPIPISAPAPSIVSCASIDIVENGGPLLVTSVGPITPTGIAIASELGLAGDLVVSGTLPYLTAVEFEGQFPTSGVVPVSYGCGDYVTINEEIGGNTVSGRAGLASIAGRGCRY